MALREGKDKKGGWYCYFVTSIMICLQNQQGEKQERQVFISHHFLVVAH